MYENEARIRPVVHEVERQPVPTPEPHQKTNRNYKKILLTILLTALAASFIAGGLFVYFSASKVNPSPSPSPTALALATPTPSPSPSPTPEPLPDLTEIKINILNGSGKIGEAGKVGDLLEKAGFESITTGNASRFDYEETVIEASETILPNVVNLIKDALTSSYEVSLGDTLATSSKYDLVITVGSK